MSGRRWAGLSLRLRVTLVAGLAVATGLAAAATLLVLSLQAGLVSGLDDAAQSRAATAAGAVERGDLSASVSTVGVDSLVQILASDGTVVASSPGLAVDRPLVVLPVGAGVRQQADASIAERDARVLTQTVSGGRVVVVVSPLADVQESTAQLIRRLLTGAPVLLALICAAVWALVGYTLRTVERLREQVARLSVTGPADRVGLPAARDEIRQLAVTMNDLLDRLQAAAAAQRRFVADAAHELRSPLSALRTRLEVSERAGNRVAPVLIQDAERLGQLIDDLLALARLDESPRLVRPVPVDLDDIVLTEVSRLRGGAVVLDTRGVAPALLYGDPDLLRRIVGNLLSNAVRHAAHRVRISVSTSDGQVELVVADDGPGIPAAERERVFRRFHRLDDARARDGGGSGLGLAIVRDAARAHRGTVTIQDDRPGAVLTVWLPQAPD